MANETNYLLVLDFSISSTEKRGEAIDSTPMVGRQGSENEVNCLGPFTESEEKIFVKASRG